MPKTTKSNRELPMAEVRGQTRLPIKTINVNEKVIKVPFAFPGKYSISCKKVFRSEHLFCLLRLSAFLNMEAENKLRAIFHEPTGD
jgi:hypothetical protein